MSSALSISAAPGEDQAQWRQPCASSSPYVDFSDVIGFAPKIHDSSQIRPRTCRTTTDAPTPTGMCTCQTKQRQLKANLLAGEAKRVSYEGRQTLIVPVVMARADVVMNDGIVPVEEMVPYAWNGVAVTVG